MRIVQLVLTGALVASGCAHHALDNHYGMATLSPVGQTHEPYRGKPKYLAEARPLQPQGKPASDNPCQQRSRACDDRLRAALAAIDGHILAMSTPPTETELAALRLSLDQVGPLLAPYPDIAAEREELGTLPSASPVDQETKRKRMTELTDLIRIQLAAAQ
jgi:hypothetical protein